jgi:hypothetical protein
VVSVRQQYKFLIRRLWHRHDAVLQFCIKVHSAIPHIQQPTFCGVVNYMQGSPIVSQCSQTLLLFHRPSQTQIQPY